MDDIHARVYAPTGRLAHLLPFRESADLGFPALCGLKPGKDKPWHGTGTQFEYEYAQRLPLCPRCNRVKAGLR